ncbi:hypothetical protein, partial [Phocaeicola sp.]|uniref:hypothetical protein n=1 Tax=Phocaeicola sp. TaxID=2773926 RepID=UPI003A95C519
TAKLRSSTTYVNSLRNAQQKAFSFFASRFYKIVTESSYFRKKMLYLQLEELCDSIATQNAEIRTVAKSLPLFLK